METVKEKMILRRLILVLGILLVGVALGYWWHMMAIVRAYEYVHPAGYVASDRVKAALGYHGIRFAESDKDGKLWFERDGQWCKVFTVACLKAVEKSKER